MASTDAYRISNVELTAYTYNSKIENGKDDGVGSTGTPVVPGKTIAVDPTKIPYGSIVDINGTKYLANDTGSAMSSDLGNYTTRIDIPCFSYTEAINFGRQTADIIVYPPGNLQGEVIKDSIKKNYDIQEGTNFSESWNSRPETLSETQLAAANKLSSAIASGGGSAVVGNALNSVDKMLANVTSEGANLAGFDSEVTEKNEAKITGAGIAGAKATETGIIDFASFVGTLAFNTQMNMDFNEDGEQTLYEYLAKFMSKFYHQIYFVPNLKNNYTILCKPETLFIQAPSCNVLFPNIKAGIGYSRPMKQEPTRILQVSDPIGQVFNRSGGELSRLLCMLFIDSEDEEVTRNGMPIHKNFVASLGEEHANLTDKTCPMLNITKFEEENGVRCTTVNKGADIWLYLKSSKLKGSSSSGKDEDKYMLSMPASKAEQVGIGMTIARLARYELLRQRYGYRNGTAECYFNPYLVPGFPFVSVESTVEQLNIYGYITDVTHNITDRSQTTSISFTCAHGDYEAAPEAFPIVESEYADKIDATYKDMLGDNIKPVSNEDVPGLIEGYNQSNKTVSSSLKKIWRETPDIESYLKEVADGATIVEDQNYWYFKNGEGSQFFDETIQARLKEYMSDIVNKGIALSNADVR